MKGHIKTYSPSTKGGVITGEDAKHYFFHHRDFLDQCQLVNLCEAALVSFDPQVKHPDKAKNCVFITAPFFPSYVTPERFITCDSEKVSGWEVIERSDWVIHKKSYISLEIANKDAIVGAGQVGANALLEFESFSKLVIGSGSGQGRTFTHLIHHCRGRAATVAKRSSKGIYP